MPVPQRDLHAALGERPGLETSLAVHLRAVLEDGTVDPALKALCAVMCAGVNYCQPLLLEHRRRARSLGVTTAKLNALWDFARSGLYGAAERAALSCAVALSREPRALPPAVWSELRAAYDDGQIAEILCTVGALNYLCRVRNAIDSEIEPD